MIANGSETPAHHILVVGDAMIDRYIIGDTRRISPEAPVPVVMASREEMRPGGAANVAANVSGLGARCTLLTICGDDGSGKDLSQLMDKYGVRLDCVIDKGQSTTQKTRLISGGQQIARIDHEGHVSDTARAELAKRLEANLSGVDGVIFSDYDKGALIDLQAMFAIARHKGIPCFVDPKSSDSARYHGAFLLKPNFKEFEALFGHCPEEEISDRAISIMEEMNIEYMVVTRGAKGIVLVSRSGAAVSHPTEALEVFDVTGAGDTVIAALAVGVTEGLSIDTAIDQANVAASIAVSRPGTYVVTRSDLEEKLLFRGQFLTKLISLGILARRIDHARESGARVVFTNGCFDVLHAGHVRLLNFARKQGDILIVGVNSDSSVQRLKGPERPVNDLADRAEVLSNLSAVDYVIAFEDDTPIDLIKALQPDVLVKGNDYTVETVVGADFVHETGGKVVLAPILAGRSTTAILEALRGSTNTQLRTTKI